MDQLVGVRNIFALVETERVHGPFGGLFQQSDQFVHQGLLVLVRQRRYIVFHPKSRVAIFRKPSRYLNTFSASRGGEDDYWAFLEQSTEQFLRGHTKGALDSVL